MLGFVNLYHLVGSVLCAGGFVGLFAVPVFGYLLWHKGLSTTYWFMIDKEKAGS